MSTISDILRYRNTAVVLCYTFTGLNDWIPITSDTTDSLGNYEATWIPPATGYFVVRASWAEKATHLASDINTRLSCLAYNDQYVFSVESNSTITALAFNTDNWKLSFAATGPNGTIGFVRVIVAKRLVANIANMRVFLDGVQSNFSIASLDGSWLLASTYSHSTHQVEVDLGTIIIPELSGWVMLLSLITAFATVIIWRERSRDWIVCLKRALPVKR